MAMLNNQRVIKNPNVHPMSFSFRPLLGLVASKENVVSTPENKGSSNTMTGGCPVWWHWSSSYYPLKRPQKDVVYTYIFMYIYMYIYICICVYITNDDDPFRGRDFYGWTCSRAFGAKDTWFWHIFFWTVKKHVSLQQWGYKQKTWDYNQQKV